MKTALSQSCHFREEMTFREEETMVGNGGDISSQRSIPAIPGRNHALSQYLFGDKTDTALSYAYAVLSKPAYDMRELLGICFLTGNKIESVATIITTAVVDDPHKAHLWLDMISWEFSNVLDDPERKREAFFVGTTIGLFDAVTMLDTRWFDPQFEFIEKFPEWIAAAVMADVTAEVGSEWSGRLSSAIKLWVRSRGNAGARLAQVRKLVQYLCVLIAERGKRENTSVPKLSPLGEAILEQITYAAFGHFAVTWRARAIDWMFDDALMITTG